MAAARRTQALLLAGVIAGSLGLTGCAPAARPGSLAPTLVMEERGGAQIAFQGGIPVPTFEAQPRPRIDLSGQWRVDKRRLDADLSLTERERALPRILEEAAGRESTSYDDAAWPRLYVPGALNAPPDGTESGAWYRRGFFVPASWRGKAATLKAGAINYLADVWVNGTYVGYHEGGYTPFAMDVSTVLTPGVRNVIAVRVDNPAWGTRNDIVPWGLADWWNYGGITRPIWIEASDPIYAARADAVPHLDGVDVSVVLARARWLVGELEAQAPGSSGVTPAGGATAPAGGSGTGSASATPSAQASEGVQGRLRVAVLAAEVRPDNVASPLASDLVPPGARPFATNVLELPTLDPGDVVQLDSSFLLGNADQWTPARPALYVLHITLLSPDGSQDELWTTFGLRRVGVNTTTAQLLLNGEPTMFAGVGLHDEVIEPGVSAVEDDSGGISPEDAKAHRVTSTDELLRQLEHARSVDADLLRTGHTPANPLLLMLADRLGFAVWEEIPLYHYTPLTYAIAMGRGIPQQMLREMALRDMNHPSVLFHGLSNESTGTDERESALRTLHDVDRQIDGTRLTGQAAYGSTPDDPTQAPLDVSGFTFYYGVFYANEPMADTARAVNIAHATFPDKPIMALEFGRWSDGPDGPARQDQVFAQTFPVFARRSSARIDGYVGAAVWWTLEDFTTMRPGIDIEHFGLLQPDGQPRPAFATARSLFAARAGGGAEQGIESNVGRAGVSRAPRQADLRLIGYLAYGFGFSLAVMAMALAIVTLRGGRASAPRRGTRS